MQKRKCSSSCVVSPFVELHCHQYKSLCTDCQPHNFTFPRAARNFVEKHGLFSRSVCRNRAFYTKEGSPFCPFPAAKRRVLQGVMPNVHTFSSFSRPKETHPPNEIRPERKPLRSSKYSACSFLLVVFSVHYTG